MKSNSRKKSFRCPATQTNYNLLQYLQNRFPVQVYRDKIIRKNNNIVHLFYTIPNYNKTNISLSVIDLILIVIRHFCKHIAQVTGVKKKL